MTNGWNRDAFVGGHPEGPVGRGQGFHAVAGGEAELCGEALGMDMVHEQTEAAVGQYSADLVLRKESTNRIVVVENM